jgi:hypothetical protein
LTEVLRIFFSFFLKKNIPPYPSSLTSVSKPPSHVNEYSLSTCSRELLEKLIFPRIVKQQSTSSNSCVPHPRQICLYSDRHSPFPLILFIYDPFDAILPSTSRSFKWCFSFWLLCLRYFPPHTWHTPSLVTHLNTFVLVRSTNCKVPHLISPASFSSYFSGPNIAMT